MTFPNGLHLSKIQWAVGNLQLKVNPFWFLSNQYLPKRKRILKGPRDGMININTKFPGNCATITTNFQFLWRPRLLIYLEIIFGFREQWIPILSLQVSMN